MIFIIKTSELSEDEVHFIYENIMWWILEFDTNFEITIEKDTIPTADELDHILSFESIQESSISGDLLVLRGKTTLSTIQYLLENAPPSSRYSGDLIPVMDVRFILNGKNIYTIKDYGRDQFLDIDNDMYEDLMPRFKRFDKMMNVIEPFITDI